MHILLTKNITRLYACIHKYLAFKYISGLGMQLMAEECFLPVQGCRLSAQFWEQEGSLRKKQGLQIQFDDNKLG